MADRVEKKLAVEFGIHDGVRRADSPHPRDLRNAAWGTEQSRAVAELMAPRLGWDQVETERQVADYAAQVVLTQGWRQR